MRNFFSSLSWTHLALLLGVTFGTLAVPAPLPAQGGQATGSGRSVVGVDQAFVNVTANVVRPIVLGVRGLGMALAVAMGLFAIFKAVREADGTEALKAVGLFFFALFLFNPMLITDSILNLELGTSLRAYGIQSGFN